MVSRAFGLQSCMLAFIKLATIGDDRPVSKSSVQNEDSASGTMNFRRLIIASGVFGLIFLAMPIGGSAWAHNSVQSAVKPSQVQVYLFRGLADIFSRGMDTLTNKLNREGYYARVYSHNHLAAITNEIIDRYSRGHQELVVLIGHSLGANATIEVSNELNKRNIPVEMVVTFDATHPYQVPKNVLHAVNFYQLNGFGEKLSAGAGFQGELSNIDLTADTSLSHITIDKSDRLHSHVLGKIGMLVEKDLAKRVAATKPKPKKTKRAS